MRSGFDVRDLAIHEQFDEERVGDVKDVGGLLSREYGADWHELDHFAAGDMAKKFDNEFGNGRGHPDGRGAANPDFDRSLVMASGYQRGRQRGRRLRSAFGFLRRRQSASQFGGIA